MVTSYFLLINILRRKKGWHSIIFNFKKGVTLDNYEGYMFGEL